MTFTDWISFAGVATFAVVAATATGCESSSSSNDRVVATTNTQHAVVTPKVLWPAQSTRDERAFNALIEAPSAATSNKPSDDAATRTKRANDLLARSPVPVLAPTNLSAFERPTFIVGAEFYALTGRVPSTSAGSTSIATVSIHGKRAAHRYDDIAPVAGNHALRGGTIKGFVSMNEGIRTSSWIENGVAYSVDVECSELQTDTRCDGEAFVVDVVEHLAFAGSGGTTK